VGAVARALQSGHSAGFAGDVWFPRPAPPDHPWRTMSFHGLTPPMSGPSLSAQARCAAGTLEMLESHFSGAPIREAHLIIDSGVLAGTGVTSYKLT
jgi:formate dehydrogenase